MGSIEIDSEHILTGSESRDITVVAGGHLRLLGVAAGSIRVLAGGRLYLGGIVAGSLAVEAQGEALIRGRLDGQITLNDGVILVAEGAFVGERVMGHTGLDRARPGSVHQVTDDTPTHQVSGTGTAVHSE